MTTHTRTDSKVGATCGNTGLDYPVGSQGLNSAPSRTEFEAAALPPLPATEWCGLVHQSGPYEPEWTSSQDGYTAEDMENYARTAIAAHAAQTERERFEAAAYRHIRNPKNWTQDFLIINDDHTKFTHSAELDAKLAAAMGWPTVPEVKS